jgi:inorganic pyrophosphatase
MAAGKRNAKEKARRRTPGSLPARDGESGELHVLVDTARGSAVKYKLDVEKAVYKVAHFLPAGMAFPFDFGSVPGTLADDGDPVDLLVIAEAGTFPGCLMTVRLIGALLARQTQAGKTMRNDRLIGVASESRTYAEVRRMDDLPSRLIDEVERFFVSYNEARGRRFRVIRRVGPSAAKRLVRDGEKRFQKER